MKRHIFLLAAAVAALAQISCNKNISIKTDKAVGTLSFSEFLIDETVETKSAAGSGTGVQAEDENGTGSVAGDEAGNGTGNGTGNVAGDEAGNGTGNGTVARNAVTAGGNYSIFIYDSDNNLKLSTSYSEVTGKGGRITLPAGDYTLTARSTVEEVPFAAVEQPVYGASKSFTISAGETTEVGSLTCTLLQCKVTVSYSEDFLAEVTGDGTATVEVAAGHPLTFALDGTKKTYDQSAGYFAVNNGENTTMSVTFKGSFGGKNVKMPKVFTGIQPKQWRQIKFIKKIDYSGNATFDISIDGLVDDEELGNDIDDIDENIIGDDPSAPKGDGGITLSLDHESGCDAEFADLENLLIPTVEQRDVCLKLLCEVPDGVKKFTVDIDSDNESFLSAVDAADARNLDLINPTSDNEIIFSVVPFPHGAELAGQTSIAFDLSAAQDAIINYRGTHTFKMNVTDTKGCRKSIPVKMIVE